MPISRRHNEHKTRPCSLVLMRRCRYLPATSSFVLRPSYPVRVFPSLTPLCSVSISDDTPKCFISRGPSRANGSAGREPDRKGNTTHRHCFTVIRVRAQSDRARAIKDIDSESRVSGLPRETINYTIIDLD